MQMNSFVDSTLESTFTFGDESQPLKETCHEPRKETSAYFSWQLAVGDGPPTHLDLPDPARVSTQTSL